MQFAELTPPRRRAGRAAGRANGRTERPAIHTGIGVSSARSTTACIAAVGGVRYWSFFRSIVRVSEENGALFTLVLLESGC